MQMNKELNILIEVILMDVIKHFKKATGQSIEK
ncbi:hypothetical protein BCL90_5141 [Pedobacter alluvionis]|uniref:Uncharacterized protein n=1 Tax=Pedobacter alluvionis TaxID=475253 RepID=A0A497XNG1_9SPHI|nr:hypothetical protein BCL90_5141 [Pedobacter alluvionis]